MPVSPGVEIYFTASVSSTAFRKTAGLFLGSESGENMVAELGGTGEVTREGDDEALGRRFQMLEGVAVKVNNEDEAFGWVDGDG